MTEQEFIEDYKNVFIDSINYKINNFKRGLRKWILKYMEYIMLNI